MQDCLQKLACAVRKRTSRDGCHKGIRGGGTPASEAEAVLAGVVGTADPPGRETLKRFCVHPALITRGFYCDNACHPALKRPADPVVLPLAASCCGVP